MESPRAEKVAVVDEVRAKFDAADAALLTEYRGLNVAATSALRRALSDAGGEYKIYKNTLVRFAARDLGLELDHLLTGSTAIAFVAGDPVQVAKTLRDFARGNPALVVKGGLLGEHVLDADGVRALAEVEPREVILAKLAGALAAPMQQFAGLLQALPRNLAYGLQALLDSRGGAPSADTGPTDTETSDTETSDTETSDTETSEVTPADAPADDVVAGDGADDGAELDHRSDITDTQPASVLPEPGTEMHEPGSEMPEPGTELTETATPEAIPAPGDITDAQPASILPDPTAPPAPEPADHDPEPAEPAPTPSNQES